MSSDVFLPPPFFEELRIVLLFYNISHTTYCLCYLNISSSLNMWWNSPVKPSGPGLFLLGGFSLLIHSVLVRSLPTVLFPPEPAQVICMFQGPFPFLLGSSNLSV